MHTALLLAIILAGMFALYCAFIGGMILLTFVLSVLAGEQPAFTARLRRLFSRRPNNA